MKNIIHVLYMYIYMYNVCVHVTVCVVCSGLNHGLVQRLRSTWERVPHKHKRTMEVRAIARVCFHTACTQCSVVCKWSRSFFSLADLGFVLCCFVMSVM